MTHGQKYLNTHGGETIIFKHPKIGKDGRKDTPLFVFEYAEGQRKSGEIAVKSDDFLRKIETGMWVNIKDGPSKEKELLIDPNL